MSEKSSLRLKTSVSNVYNIFKLIALSICICCFIFGLRLISKKMKIVFRLKIFKMKEYLQATCESYCCVHY